MEFDSLGDFRELFVNSRTLADVVFFRTLYPWFTSQSVVIFRLFSPPILEGIVRGSWCII